MRTTYALVSALCLGLMVQVCAQEADSQDPKPAEATDQQQDAANRRKALDLLGEAELALEQGNRNRAVALAKQALAMAPKSVVVSSFLSSVRPSTPAKLRAATPLNHVRAKAHLAAALSRAQVLMGQRRYTEALDMLNGIIEASKRFPNGSGVTIYQDLAKKELTEYKAGVQSGRIRPSTDTVKTPGPETPEPAQLEFPEAPTNAVRLSVIARNQAPPWYSRVKSSLRRKMSVDYRSMPLGLVLEEIQEVTGVPVIVDTPVKAARTTLTAVVDLRVGSVPAEMVLSFTTQVAGCEYVILEKGVIVTTRDKAGDYIRNLPDVVANQWAQARFLFPELYVDAVSSRPLPGVETDQSQRDQESIPAFLRSGNDLVADIERLIQ